MAGLVIRTVFCIVPIMWLTEQKPSVCLGGFRQEALHRNGFAAIQPDAAAWFSEPPNKELGSSPSSEASRCGSRKSCYDKWVELLIIDEHLRLRQQKQSIF